MCLRVREKRNLFEAFFAYGLGLLFAGQAMINIGVNIGLLPTKGLTLPFLSYGGASLIVSFFMVALLVRIQYETEGFFFYGITPAVVSRGRRLKLVLIRT